MADITKRATKKLRDHFETGEVPEVAILAEPAGTYGVAAFAAAAMPRTTGRVLDGRASDRHDAEGGIAAGLPGEAVALVVTGHRVLVAPTNGLRWKDPVLALPRGQVKVTESAGKGLGRTLGLVFADGTRARFDIQRGQPVARLVDALGQVPG